MSAIGINLTSGAAYECGATLLTVLSWPEMLGDGDAMGRRHAAICQMYLQAKAEVDAAWANQPQPIKPLYMSRPWKEVEAFDRHLQRRLRARMAAARIILPFIIEDERSGVAPRWPKGSLSLNRMAERVIDDTTESDATNVKSRVWRSSRPVIHIAAAAAVAIGHGSASGLVISVADLLGDAAVIRWVVDVATQFREIIPSIRRLHIKAEEMVQLAPT